MSTALHTACLYGHASTVKELIVCNANLRALDSKGITPLHLAAKEGYLLITQMLLEAGHQSDGWAIVSQVH